jgi:hypothetical protein
VTRLDDVSVEVRPAFIGVRSFVNEKLASGAPARGPRVYPSEIRQFGAIDFTSTVSKAQLQAIREVPEATVRKVLAEHPVLQEPIGGCADMPMSLPPTSKIFTIFEGTSEIQRMLIGRTVTGLDVR